MFDDDDYIFVDCFTFAAYFSSSKTIFSFFLFVPPSAKSVMLKYYIFVLMFIYS